MVRSRWVGESVDGGRCFNKTLIYKISITDVYGLLISNPGDLSDRNLTIPIKEFYIFQG